MDEARTKPKCRAIVQVRGEVRRCEKTATQTGLCGGHERAFTQVADLREANRWILVGGPFHTTGSPALQRWRSKAVLPEALESPLPTIEPERYGQLWQRFPETVYFVRAAGLVKIGKTDNIEHRLRSLTAMSPIPLELARVVKGALGLECNLHRYFKNLRHHGEWFDDEAWQQVENLSDTEIRELATLGLEAERYTAAA